MAAAIVDIFLVYQFLKRLVTPFDKTDAYKLGLIDADGKSLRKAKTSEEKQAVGYFDRLVFNLKRLLALVPGGKTVLGSYIAALLLLREQDEKLNSDNTYLNEEFKKQMNKVNMKEFEKFREVYESITNEDAPANATGAAVVGTGDDPVHWIHRGRKRMQIGERGNKKHHGVSINGVEYLRRKNIKAQYNQWKPVVQKKTFYKSINKYVLPYKSSSSKGGDDGNGNGE